MTRSGRDVAAASAVIGMDDVLEARIASGGERRVGRPEELLLRPDVLDDRLDHQVGGGELGALGDAGQHVPVGGPPLASSFSRLARMPARPRSTAPWKGVVEEHLTARGGDDLSDAGAHLTGADDEDALEPHRRERSGGTAPPHPPESSSRALRPG